jgi:RimJ/RimL family protein N-acetyltransferase
MTTTRQEQAMPARNERSADPGTGEPIQVRFEAVSEAHAREVLTWRYAPPYDFYNPPAELSEADLAAMLSPASPHYAVIDAGGRLVGFIGLGREAQVPGGDYSAEATDIGIGLRPDWTGRGLGRIVLEQFFTETGLNGKTLRATIAAFNLRSRRTFHHLGFQECGVFRTGSQDAPITWVILQRPPQP